MCKAKHTKAISLWCRPCSASHPQSKRKTWNYHLGFQIFGDTFTTITPYIDTCISTQGVINRTNIPNEQFNELVLRFYRSRHTPIVLPSLKTSPKATNLESIVRTSSLVLGNEHKSVPAYKQNTKPKGSKKNIDPFSQLYSSNHKGKVSSCSV